MIRIVITASNGELDAAEEGDIEDALDDIMAGLGLSDYSLLFE
jgi:hypothetical protein